MRGVYNMTMKTTCNTAAVLAKVRANREEHALIVAEAITGYMAKFKEELAARLDLARAWAPGQRAISPNFDLTWPIDHRGEYDTVLQMLELHQEATIVLNADEVRQFMMNEWEWMRDFLVSNAHYSERARSLSA